MHYLKSAERSFRAWCLGYRFEDFFGVDFRRETFFAASLTILLFAETLRGCAALLRRVAPAGLVLAALRRRAARVFSASAAFSSASNSAGESGRADLRSRSMS